MNHTAMAAARNINNAFKMDIIGERQAQRYFKEFRGGLPYERKKASGMRKTGIMILVNYL
jgi:hypothetical protein